jgi:hypothetical protein
LQCYGAAGAHSEILLEQAVELIHGATVSSERNLGCLLVRRNFLFRRQTDLFRWRLGHASNYFRPPITGGVTNQASRHAAQSAGNDLAFKDTEIAFAR